MTSPTAQRSLAKAPSGIMGLDELTGGGLPRGRTTLVCGGPGCGKTLMGLQFVVRGALDHGEPGVVVAFEERADALSENVASLGWDLAELVERRLLVIDHMRVVANEIVETGEWDLDGLLLRLGAAIEEVGAKRVVIDSVELLFSALENERLLRAELRRVFDWLAEQGVTAVVTGERGSGMLTRHGLEEYVSDCVIFLDHRVSDEVTTRRMRIVKYRGSSHGTDEQPFLIDHDGMSVVPVSAMRLDHGAPDARIGSGNRELDEMLAGGCHRGSTVLIAGTAGSGKTTLGASFLAAACGRGERSMLFAFEEAPDQIIRNMASVGLDMARWRAEGLLRILSVRPSGFGLEGHLARIHRDIADFDAQNVVLDPVTALQGDPHALQAMLTRLVDFLKTRGITAHLTALDRGQGPSLGISSLVDTWIELLNARTDGSRTRAISVVKARGIAHSSELRQFRLTARGFEIAGRLGHADDDVKVSG